MIGFWDSKTRAEGIFIQRDYIRLENVLKMPPLVTKAMMEVEWVLSVIELIWCLLKVAADYGQYVLTGKSMDQMKGILTMFIAEYYFVVNEILGSFPTESPITTSCKYWSFTWSKNKELSSRNWIWVIVKLFMMLH